MIAERIEQALQRLDTALARVEAATEQALQRPVADPAELAALQDRHGLLKQSVARSLRQLDEILADIAP